MTDSGGREAAAGPADERRPLLFILHRDADSMIADVIREFVISHSLSRVDVFQSASGFAAGPRIGENPNEELLGKLWEASVVILVYTSEDQDWGYRVWQRGVATRPDSLAPRIILFQCGARTPPMFSDQARIDVRSFADVLRFTKELMTNPDFFARHNHAITPGFRPDDVNVEAAARFLFDSLQTSLAPSGQDEVAVERDWVELPGFADRLDAAVAGDVEGSLKKMLREAARRGVVPASRHVATAAVPWPTGGASRERRPPPAPAGPEATVLKPRPGEATETFDDLYLGLRTGGALRKMRRGEALTSEEEEALGRWQRRSAWRKAVLIGGGLTVALLAAAAAAKWLLGWFVASVEPAEAVRDIVECTVFAPPAAAPGDLILVQAFVHLSEQADDARAIAMELDTAARRRTFRSLESYVPLGGRLHFELRMPGLEIDEPVASLVWRRRTEAVQFGVRIPPSEQSGTKIGTLAVSLDSAPIGHIKFKLAIERHAAPASNEPQGEQAGRYATAFISYASADRGEVLRRVQVLSIIGIKYFQDVLSLEPGDRWLKRIELGIDECDLFLLFWSNEAKGSSWVRREVQYALARKDGNDLSPPEIRPVILEGPPIVEPWEELADLHFNDALLYFMRPPQTG